MRLVILTLVLATSAFERPARVDSDPLRPRLAEGYARTRPDTNGQAALQQNVLEHAVEIVAFNEHASAASSPVRDANGFGSVTEEEAISRLRRHPIIASAIEQAVAFTEARNCSFQFARLRDLTQFEPGSAFEYAVRISCTSDSEGYDSSATVEIEGQSINYGEGLQDIGHLSFRIAG